MEDSYFKACLENNHSLVSMLLSEGANINWRTGTDGCQVDLREVTGTTPGTD